MVAGFGRLARDRTCLFCVADLLTRRLPRRDNWIKLYREQRWEVKPYEDFVDGIGTITASFAAAWDPKESPPSDEGSKFRDP
jgi:hypothetical protein